MSYEKDLLKSVMYSIPCMHMPAKPMAIKSLKEFKEYLESSESNGLSISDVVIDLERIIEQNAG